MHDMIILGGGAAGLSAAAIAIGKHLDVRLIAEHIGGRAGTHQELAEQQQPEYIAGEEAVAALAQRVRGHGDVFVRDVVGLVQKKGGLIHVETHHHGTLSATTLVIATGVTPISLEVPGAHSLAGYGIGYSASTHAHLLAGKTAAVVGSTPRALRGTNELARSAEKVYLIATDPQGLLTPLGIALQYRYNVEVLKQYEVRQINGTYAVESIELRGPHDTRTLPVDAVFVDLGLRPNSGMVKHMLQTDLNGFIRVDSHNATSVAGVFAAGDVTTVSGEQALIAVGDGARAAMNAYDYILARPPVHA